MVVKKPLLPGFPDNDDPTVEAPQTDLLVQARDVLANPEAKVGDLGKAVHSLLLDGLGEAIKRQAVRESIDVCPYALPGWMRNAGDILADRKAKVGDLGEAREFFRSWLTELTKHPAVTDSIEADSDGLPRVTESSECTRVLDPRLQTLVVDAVDALSEGERVVQDRVRTGIEIALAIPDVEAFLAEVAVMQEGTFFELNGDGQLVMMDGCEEAYGLGETALQARMRQTRIVYKDAKGQTQVMTGEQYFGVTKRDAQGNPLEMGLSEAAIRIDPESILMAKGLPILKWYFGIGLYGEYARMNDRGRFDGETETWTEDDAIKDGSSVRTACWNKSSEEIYSTVRAPSYPHGRIGSRGVLRVNLNFES